MAIFSAPAAHAAANTYEKLRSEATKAREELEKATAEMKDRKQALEESQEKLRTTLKALAVAEAELNRIREPVARLANTSYQHPDATGYLAVLGGGNPVQVLRSTTDVAMLAQTQQSLVDRADGLQRRHKELVSTQQELQSSNAVEQARVEQDVSSLKKRSADLTEKLNALLGKLPRSKQVQLKCDESLVAEAKGFPNGLIPSKYLCDLPQSGHELRADAALGFYKLNTAYKERFGREMCVTDAYRSLSEQHSVYARRPGFAAVPGTSNHGKGQALDLCGGIQNAGSVQFNWMEANAEQYGWFHPAWAYSNPFEPWHWEYGTDSAH
ncbi:peptidase M15 [Actinomadura sp. CNU-125]|nr:peptidase M15 [Actinomadura sp. CNU-125]